MHLMGVFIRRMKIQPTSLNQDLPLSIGERRLDHMGTAKSEAKSPGVSCKCSYVQEPVKETFKRPFIFPILASLLSLS